MKHIKTITFTLIIFFIHFILAQITIFANEELDLYADSCIVMELDTGTILYGKDIDKKAFPASTTKILTTIIGLEEMELTDTIHFSNNAVSSITKESSQIGIRANETLTLEQTLYAIMLASANEVANGLAENVSGSLSSFADTMNKYATDIGCTNSHFTNAHGLHNEEHYTSAHDMALIAQYAYKNETFRKIIGTKSYQIEKTNLRSTPISFDNHHKMVTQSYPYEYATGGKTGFTLKAQNTLVTFAEKDGVKLVAVVFKCPGGGNYTYQDTKTLLDYGFQKYATLDIAKENQNESGVTESLTPETIVIENSSPIENIYVQNNYDFFEKNHTFINCCLLSLVTIGLYYSLKSCYFAFTHKK